MSDVISVAEVWKPAVGHEYYEVSNAGRVRSLDKIVPCGRYPGGHRLAKGRILSVDKTRAGYLRVKVTNARWRSVHSLVAEAFIGPRPTGTQVCHNDGDKMNNRPENLRYDTASENVRDSVRHGTQAQARKTHCPSGHAYDEQNTQWVRTRSGRGRNCRACHRMHMAARRRAVRAVQGSGAP